MRNMSFALTTPQILARRKTVTRRLGWQTLKAGETIQAIEKGQGLKKGEKARKLAVLRVESVRRERLDAITQQDVYAEGFSGMDCAAFIDMFCRSHRPCEYWWAITRIEFSYIDALPSLDDQEKTTS